MEMLRASFGRKKGAVQPGRFSEPLSHTKLGAVLRLVYAVRCVAEVLSAWLHEEGGLGK